MTAPSGVEPPDISQIVIDDGAPVESMLSEKEMRLLTEPLYTSWQGPPPREEGVRRPFLAAADVGLFATPHEPPLVPDVSSAWTSQRIRTCRRKNVTRPIFSGSSASRPTS